MAPPKVFISYSHDSKDHQQRVLELSNKLRRDGIDSQIDQYEVNPIEGWPLWMQRKIEESDFVLVICSETYLKRFRGEEAIGLGLGARWESFITQQFIYKAGAKNEKFIPVIFGKKDSEFIPEVLTSFRWFCLEEPKGYPYLVRRIMNLAPEDEPPLGLIESNMDLPPLKPLPRQADFFYEKIDRVHYPSVSQSLPLKAIYELRVPKSNLPTKPLFYGRTNDLFEIRKALKSRTKLLLITGDPGVGKTTIALFVARDLYEKSKRKQTKLRLTDLFNSFIYIPPLPSDLSLTELLDQIAITLGYEYLLHLHLNKKRVEINRILEQIRTLLVIPDLDSFLDPELIEYLSTLPDSCQVIATANGPLSIPAVQVDLNPLNESDALQLIRSETNNLPVSIKKHLDADWLKLLCKATHGHPLAIQWAVSLFENTGETIDILIEKLEKDSPPNPVEYIFTKIWKNISAAQKNVLMALTEFPDLCTFEASQNVSGLEKQFTMNALEQLVKMRLVNEIVNKKDRESRFSINTVVKNLIENLSYKNKRDTEDFENRFIDYYLEFVDKKSSWVNSELIDDMAKDKRNILSAMNFCNHLGRQREFIKFHLNTFHMLWAKGYWEQSWENALKAVSAAQTLRMVEEASWISLESLGWIEFCRGNYEETRNHYDDAKRVLEDPKNHKGMSRLRNYYGRLEAALRNYPTAIELLWDGLRYSEDELTTSFLESALADGYYALENFDRAIEHYQSVKKYREKIGDNFRLCSVLCDLADLSNRIDDMQAARMAYLDSLNLAKVVGRLEIEARCEKGLGEVELKLGDKNEARKRLEQAAECFFRLGRERELLRIKETLGDLDTDRISRNISSGPALSGYKGIDAMLINAPREIPITSASIFQDQRIPLGLANISSFLRNRGLSCRILDAEAESIGLANIVQRVYESNPKVVGINCHTLNRHVVYEIVKTISFALPEALLVVGGAHPALAPVSTLEECPEIDVVVTGEGERVMYEICRRREEIEKIPGIYFLKDNRLPQQNPDMPGIHNLDILGFPDLESIPIKRYLNYEERDLPGLWKRAYLNASRGCKFRCAYCTENPFWTGQITFRSASSIGKEMKEYTRLYKTFHFYFYDDNFTDWPELSEFLEIAHDHCALWSCSTRIDALDEKLIQNLSWGGCREIAFGLESGSEKTLKRIHKNWFEKCPKIEVGQIIKTCSEFKIVPRTHFMIGFPWEDKEDITETIKFAVKLKDYGLNDANFFVVKVYPGTILDNAIRGPIASEDWREQVYDAWSVHDWHKTKNPKVSAKLRRFNDIPKISIHPTLDSLSMRQVVKNAYEIFFSECDISQVDEILWKGVRWEE